ncbi:hypothetical protein AB1Y20_023406 [Prymnesium parvum]|uniref:Uncharacterized protein n=1 Tax=Prymnesium parvum TaxID=97485 RepID=A0AB34JEJ7_PRYPA
MAAPLPTRLRSIRNWTRTGSKGWPEGVRAKGKWTTAVCFVSDWMRTVHPCPPCSVHGSSGHRALGTNAWDPGWRELDLGLWGGRLAALRGGI